MKVVSNEEKIIGFISLNFTYKGDNLLCTKSDRWYFAFLETVG